MTVVQHHKQYIAIGAYVFVSFVSIIASFNYSLEEQLKRITDLRSKSK